MQICAPAWSPSSVQANTSAQSATTPSPRASRVGLAISATLFFTCPAPRSGHLPVSTRQMHNLPCKKTRKSALVVVPGDAQAANSRAKTCPRHTGAGAHASKIHKHVADSTRIPAVNAAGKDRVLMAAVRSHAILAHVLPAL
ncbi:unnamed protein product [Tilletia controversa]|nr:unnamed protein product [Tilletia controversa]